MYIDTHDYSVTEMLKEVKYKSSLGCAKEISRKS